MEDILLSDQDRQKEQLLRKIEMRAKRRRAMQNKLEEAHDEVQNLAHERQDLKEEVLVEI